MVPNTEQDLQESMNGIETTYTDFDISINVKNNKGHACIQKQSIKIQGSHAS